MTQLFKAIAALVRWLRRSQAEREAKIVRKQLIILKRTAPVSLLKSPSGQGNGLPKKRPADDSRLLEESFVRCSDLSAISLEAMADAIAGRDDLSVEMAAQIQSPAAVHAARRS